MATKNSLDVSALSCFAFCFGTRSKFQMKALAFLILIVASVARAEDFRTIDGKEYKNVTVSRVEPDGIVLRTKSGISKVYFVKLPKEVQDPFSFQRRECCWPLCQTSCQSGGVSTPPDAITKSSAGSRNQGQNYGGNLAISLEDASPL